MSGERSFDLAAATEFLAQYSRAVSAVAATVAQAVVRVDAGGGRGRWRHGRARVGHGSGFVLNAEAGHVITSFHIVRGAERAEIRWADGRMATGEAVGADAISDLAVLKVAGVEGLAALTLGDSDALAIGQFVLALGNPDGDRGVATAGIVSSLGRSLPGPAGRPIDGLIQTNAIFNPGMSGGPLVDYAGRVVGINTASLIEAQGINLAIPINNARKLVTELIEKGQVKRARLGIAGERTRIYPALIEHHKLEHWHGVLVHGVEENSNAARAGLQQGDILIAIDGETVRGMDELGRVLGRHTFGDTLAVRLLRGLEALEVSVKLEE